MRLPIALLNISLILLSVVSGAQVTPSPLVLTGDIKGTQNQTHIEVPFQVPPGVHRISVDFSYTERYQSTTIDLAILDPQRFR